MPDGVFAWVFRFSFGVGYRVRGCGCWFSIIIYGMAFDLHLRFAVMSTARQAYPCQLSGPLA